MIIILSDYSNAEYISLTGVARYREAERSNYILETGIETAVVLNLWARGSSLTTLIFNSIEFDGIKNQSGVNL